MRFSKVIVAYFFTGASMIGAGVIPFDKVNPVSHFVSGPDDPAVDGSVVGVGPGGEPTGMFGGLIGPVRSALDTIVGGSLLAVWGAIKDLLGLYAWPVTAATHVNAPSEVVLLMVTFVVVFTFGVLRMFKASI